MKRWEQGQIRPLFQSSNKTNDEAGADEVGVSVVDTDVLVDAVSEVVGAAVEVGVDIVAVDVVWAAAEVVVGAADVVSAVDVAAAVDVGVADEAGTDVEGVEESVGAGEGEEAEEISVLEADAGEYKGLETTVEPSRANRLTRRTRVLTLD